MSVKHKNGRKSDQESRTELSTIFNRSTPRAQTPLAFAWAVGAFLNNGASSQTLTELIVCVGGR